MNGYISRLLPWAVVFVALSTINPYLPVNLVPTALGWGVQSAIVVALGVVRARAKKTQPTANTVWLDLYLLWNLVSIARGALIAEDYWDWKILFDNGLSILVPLAAYIAFDPDLTKIVLRRYAYAGTAVFALVAGLIVPGAYGFYLAGIQIFIIAALYLPRAWMLLFLGLGGLASFADLFTRSNLIKFGTSILLVSWHGFRYFVPLSLLELLRKAMFILPFVLFHLAVAGQFNIFNVDEYVEESPQVTKTGSEGKDENITTDTRTPLYVEVLETAETYDSWWFGRSPARGNETSLFAELAEITGRSERSRNEAAILNIFTWTGILGVALCFLSFYHASWLALNRSNNTFSKMLGMFIAFRWIYSWVEDGNSFSIVYFSLWVMVGMCYSESFRRMSDADLSGWFRSALAWKPRSDTDSPND